MWPLRHGTRILRELVLLLACGGPTDAERYAAALDPEVPLEEAIAGCEGMRESEVGDCMTAAFETRESLGDCDSIASPLWAEECLFLQGERMRLEGRLEEAIAACEQTRFARECTFHLVRDEARSVSSEDVLSAKLRLDSLPPMRRAPDVEPMFWRQWFIARRLEGEVVDRRVCEVLADPRPCYEGADKTWDIAVGGLPRDLLCPALAAGEPPLTLPDGTPQFVPDEPSLRRARRLCP